MYIPIITKIWIKINSLRGNPANIKRLKINIIIAQKYASINENHSQKVYQNLDIIEKLSKI